MRYSVFVIGDWLIAARYALLAGLSRSPIGSRLNVAAKRRG
jgi:hypothetical protein